MKFATCALALLFIAATAQASDPLKVKTDKGSLQGVTTPDGQIIAFKGIPYAAPPIGPLRWQPPQPAAKWSGTRSAADFGSRCMQGHTYDDMIFHDPGPSEDCLTLNVWKPAHADKHAHLPVMVWIYGGGFAAGGTSEARQDGQFLAHRNVIVVSMNYRLGIFGFFTHPELTAESPHHASGNYAFLDQAAALAWVRRNIAAFGGDPANITLFGESAGSFSVSTLMASPLSRDLIAKAIGESGAAFAASGLTYPTRESAEPVNLAFAQTVFHTTKLSDLRALSADDLLKAVADPANKAPRFAPVVDGYLLPQSVPEIYAAGHQAHVPLLAGWNADEVRGSVTLAKIPVTAESFKAQAQSLFGDHAEDFLKVYPAATDQQAIASAGDFASDTFIAFSTWRWIESHQQTGHSPVYRYLLALGSPGDKYHPAALGAFHSDDIEYVFGTLDSRPEAVWRPEDRALSDQIQQYWTNFARTGDPNGSGLPHWPTTTPADNWQLMVLDRTSAARPDNLRDRYLFLDSVWSKPAPVTNPASPTQ